MKKQFHRFQNSRRFERFKTLGKSISKHNGRSSRRRFLLFLAGSVLAMPLLVIGDRCQRSQASVEDMGFQVVAHYGGYPLSSEQVTNARSHIGQHWETLGQPNMRLATPTGMGETEVYGYNIDGDTQVLIVYVNPQHNNGTITNVVMPYGYHRLGVPPISPIRTLMNQTSVESIPVPKPPTSDTTAAFDRCMEAVRSGLF